MVAVAKPIWMCDDGTETLLAIAANVPPWQRDAACVEHDDLDWFVTGPLQTLRAKAICTRCLVQSDCVAYALDEQIDTGIWGGATVTERRELRARHVTGRLVEEHGVHAVEGRETGRDFAAFRWPFDVA